VNKSGGLMCADIVYHSDILMATLVVWRILDDISSLQCVLSCSVSNVARTRSL
jgi:hypothetical protein